MKEAIGDLICQRSAFHKTGHSGSPVLSGSSRFPLHRPQQRRNAGAYEWKPRHETCLIDGSTAII